MVAARGFYAACMDVDQPAFPRWLTPATEKALYPAWSADGSQVYYVLADAKQQFRLMVVGAAGGTPRHVPISRWEGDPAEGRVDSGTRYRW